MSAPGRRSEGKAGPGELRHAGPEDVNVMGDGRIAARREIRTLLGGWSTRDVLHRNAGELSRGGLVCLVRALREELGARGGFNQDSTGKPAEEVRSTDRNCQVCSFCSDSSGGSRYFSKRLQTMDEKSRKLAVTHSLHSGTITLVVFS